MVNFIKGFRFWSRLCISLAHEHFQNMKPSFWCLFYDLIKSIFILSLYFFFMISYNFSFKNVKLRMTYVGAILVLISIPWVQM